MFEPSLKRDGFFMNGLRKLTADDMLIIHM
jgi:hypothetical protein